MDGIEVHDCFSISEIVAYEVLGLAEPGQGAKLVETGAMAHPAVRELVTGSARTEPPFSIPVNVGGGLLADGHPVGATGVRQVAEAYLHLTGRAGERQIEGARRMLCFNMGGSFTTAVVTIWGVGRMRRTTTRRKPPARSVANGGASCFGYERDCCVVIARGGPDPPADGGTDLRRA